MSVLRPGSRSPAGPHIHPPRQKQKPRARKGTSFFALVAVEVLITGAAFVATRDYLADGPITTSAREAFNEGALLTALVSPQPEPRKPPKSVAMGATVYQQKVEKNQVSADPAAVVDLAEKPEGSAKVRNAATPVKAVAMPQVEPSSEPPAVADVAPQATLLLVTPAGLSVKKPDVAELAPVAAEVEVIAEPEPVPEVQTAMAALPPAIPAAQETTAPAAVAPQPAAAGFKDCATCPEMISISGGRVALDRTDQNALTNAHSGKYPELIVVTAFAMGRHETSFEDWELCAADGDCKRTPPDEGWGRGTRPVINVSYTEIAKQYLPWLSRKSGKIYRLPTDAEWELAARGATSGQFVSASIAAPVPGETCEIANAVKKNDGCDDGYEKTAPRGAFLPNVTGLYDMQGNVWEWVADCWYPNYTASQVVRGKDCNFRILRGGSWLSDPNTLSIATRGWETPGKARNTIGFRVARSNP